MAMDKINGSPLLQSGMLDRFQGTKTDKSKSSDEAGSAAQQSTSTQATTDKAEISETAHKLMDLRQAVDTGRAAMEQLPDLRQDKIDAAKQRIADGFYKSPEVQEKVAEKLGSVMAALDDI